MKKVLCFGDSNVYGFIPKNGQRYDKNIRWSGILSTLSKNKFEIIEAGCNNRTGFSDNPSGLEQTGYKVLPSYLENNPDCIILAIGINDLQTFYNVNQDDLKTGIEKLIKIVRSKCPAAKIILASSSKIKKNILKSYFASMFDETSIKKSYSICTAYEQAAKDYNCSFIDLDKIAETSDIDGLHYEPNEHKKIAEAMFKLLCQIFEY